MDVSISDLRAHLKANLDRVRSGEELTVTDHGKAVARLVPAREQDRLAALEAAGIIGPAPARSEPWDPDGQPRAVASGAKLVSSYVADQR